MTPESKAGSESAGAPKSFIALRHPAARMYLIGAALAMMADSVEHVISYWMIYEKFQSPALAGFAVISHWLPFLLFSFWSGSLADRYDPRRIIQLGMLLFMLVSAGWGILFWLDTLEVWHAAVLLVIHGFAGVLWAPAAQLFIHAIVGEGQLQSAIRTMASSRTLGLLFGPAVGGGLLLTFGPTIAIFLNILIYLPLTFWLFRAPEQPREEIVHKRAMNGFSDVIDTLRELATNRLVISMTILAGATSLIVGNAHQAQMPEFAHDLGEGDAGFRYSILLTANAAGALLAGIVLESRGLLPANPRTAFILALMWCGAIGGFAVSSNYYLSISLLLCAGFLDLSFNSMARTIAQLNAPASMRGRAIGLFNVSSQGLRTFSGVTIGLGGSVIGIHYSLAISAALLMVVILSVFSYFRMARLSED
tara:strand:- start:2526 stop:3788 length:1263 start_codon:yes stop_codon:yes gene_type:complete